MSSLRNRFVWVLGLFPVLFFIGITYHYSVNVPWFDDFDPFPDFLRKWITSTRFSEKVSLLFQPNNEHRMVFGKGITALYYAITGTLNFTFLHLAGISFTLGTLWLSWRAFRSTRLPAYYFLPVPFLLFQLQYHLISLWAICGLQHQPVVFFVCLTMFLLAKQKPGWAILAAFCANFAMSNGLFVWVGGAAILLFQTRYKWLAIWCVSSGAAILLYFSGMTTMGNESSIEFLLANPHLSFLGFFAFLGGLFDFAPDRTIEVRTALPILMAFLLMIWVLLWLFSIVAGWLGDVFKRPAFTSNRWLNFGIKPQFEQLGYFSLGIMLFVLANAAVIALLRPRFGFYVMVVSNYKLYPALFLTVTYLSFLSASAKGTRPTGFKAGLVLSVGIWVLTLIHYGPAISERRKYLLVNAYNQQQHAFGLGYQPGSKAAVYIDSLANFTTSRNIYQFPNELNPYIQRMQTVKQALPDSLQFSLSPVADGLAVTEPAAVIPSGYATGGYVFFRRAEKIYVFKLNQQKYTGRNLLIRYDEGLEVTVPTAAIPAGTYEWGVLIHDAEKETAGVVGTITLP
ncbi:hypothetical protein [Arundinibacter roseus]|uniref:YfhO family protein n=1 Tax=Arundinibacter roseus TaxID=2070510 RepID=A0A4R4K9E0_9BACT|nr:hypothetical protein [Arundinibacter roseus]TDB64113.1 hypothetical protein EZE20_14320 [Arundinibacter roseus]